MVIVEKPAGLHTQGTSAGDRYTLLRAVADGLGKRPQDLHLVHRLDQVTGGLLVIALSRERAAELSDSLRDHEIERGYVALVHGEWEGEVLVDQPIKHKSGAQVPAVTRMRATRFDSESSLVWAALKTGRTHQVRIHAAAQGHPVIGDAKYGSAVRLPHIALHAAYLRMGDDRWISQPPLDGPWSQWSKRPAQEEWAETFEKLYERGWAD
jgi:23S rRNA pseudouridine955/2504/2580 synthase